MGLVDSSRLRAVVAGYGRSVLRAAAEDMLEQARYQAPVDSGATRDLLRIVGERSAGTSLWCTIESPTPQARYQDEGTRPHTIRGNPLLAFQWHGRTVIVRSVDHPGSTLYRGWFSDVMTSENFAESLRLAIDRTITLAA